MNKKLTAYFLLAGMSASVLLTGCSNGALEDNGDTAAAVDDKENIQSDGNDDHSEDTDNEDLAEITVSWWSLGQVPDDENLAMVEDAINAITEDEIHTTVNLNIMDSGSYIPNGAMANGVANGEDYDLVLTAPALAGTYTNMLANGMLMPIGDLLTEYAPELLNTVPEQFLEATTVAGEIYAVPSYCNKVQNEYWVCRNEVLDTIGLDISTVKNVKDVENALKAIKEAYPDMNPMGGNSFSINLTYPGFSLASGDTTMTWDCMGEATASVAAYYLGDDTYTAVSHYEAQDFKNSINLLKSWYDQGLLDKDVATDSATSNTLKEKPNVASCFYTGQEDLAATLCEDTSYVKLATGMVATGAMQQFTWAVPVSCDEPEAAVKFMNLMYTDERIVNLMNYGVEDTHYVQKEDGTIGFPEGVTSETDGYYMGGMTKLIGNGFLVDVWEGADPESNVKAQEEMNNAIYSPLMGFAIDTSGDISDIYAQLAPIVNQEYGPALFCGSAPDGWYEEMIDKLYAAGLQEYLDNVNEQIQTWLAQNK